MKIGQQIAYYLMAGSLETCFPFVVILRLAQSLPQHA